MSTLQTPTPAETLRDALMQKQREEGKTHGAMAKKLGVSRIYWNHVVTGRKPVGLAIAQGAFFAYHDELGPLANRVFLSLNGGKRPKRNL